MRSIVIGFQALYKFTQEALGAELHTSGAKYPERRRGMFGQIFYIDNRITNNLKLKNMSSSWWDTGLNSAFVSGTVVRKTIEMFLSTDAILV